MVVKIDRSLVLIVMPAVFGAGFPLIVSSGQRLYAQSLVGVRFLIAAEAIYLLVCAFVLLAALAFAAQMVVEKKFVRLIWVVLSVAVFLYSLGIGFNYGAAILYAT